MKKRVLVAFALGAVVTLGAVTVYKRVMEELNIGLNMHPEDFNTPATVKKDHCKDSGCESITCYGCHDADCNPSESVTPDPNTTT